MRGLKIGFGLGLGALTGLLGCGGADRHEAGPRAAANPDACALIPRTEAERIVGNRLRVEADPGDGGSSGCDYMPVDASGAGFSLKVYWTDGPEQLRIAKAALGFAPKLMKQSGIKVGGMMALEPIDSLGEEAYYNPIAGSYVLTGDRLLEFDLRLLSLGQSEDPREKWLALARRAVGPS